MSGVNKKARPPNLSAILNSKKYNPSTGFPSELRDKLFLCDEDAPKLSDFRDQLNSTPPLGTFPDCDPPYGNEYFHDKQDKNALNDKRVSEIARYDELTKRKKYMKEYLEIYETAKKKFDDEKKSVQAGRSTKSTTKEDVQKIFESSKNINLDSSEDDSNSNDSFSDDNDESSDIDNNDHYGSSDDSDEPREKKRKFQEKKHQKTPKNKSDRRDERNESKKKSSKDVIDKEKNYQKVIKGKITILPFVQEVYNDQKYLLDRLKMMNSDNQSEETQKKIQEQENKVDLVYKKLKELSKMPESPSMAPQNNIKPEEIRKHEFYQKKLDLANKEIEKEKSAVIHQDKLESASSRANAIDESMKDLFKSSDSNSSDSDDGDILKEL